MGQKVHIKKRKGVMQRSPIIQLLTETADARFALSYRKVSGKGWTIGKIAERLNLATLEILDILKFGVC